MKVLQRKHMHNKNGIEFKLLSSSEEPPTTMGSIHLNKSELSLKENESETLTVSFIEMSSSTKVIWSSSDEKVAIVENGKVTAKSIGNTIITVSTEDGQYMYCISSKKSFFDRTYCSSNYVNFVK